VFAKLGHPVISLKRVRIGNLSLHGLGGGDWRFLKLDEVAKLRDIAREEMSTKESKPESANAFSRRAPRSRAAGPASKKVVRRPAGGASSRSRIAPGARGKGTGRKPARRATKQR
jgi:hypothetical protein